MDDKRTLLGFLLVGLILLLIPYYYDLVGISTPRSEPDSGSSPDSSVVRELPSVALRSIPRPESAVPPDSVPQRAMEPAKRERFVTVVTPRQRLVFGTAGGLLVSAELPEYTGVGGGPIQLLAAGGRGLALRLYSETGQGEELDLSEAHFEPDRERLEIGPEEEGSLALCAVLPGGRSVEKSVRVRGDQFGVELALRFTGFAPETVAELSWSRGIGLAESSRQIDLEAMRALAYLNDSLTELKVGDDETKSWEERGDVRWAGVRNKYFFVALSPTSKARHRVVLSGAGRSETPYREYEFAVGTRLEDVGEQWDLLIYLGPLDLEPVGRYQREFARAMDLGIPVVRQISKVLLGLFVSAHQVIPNYGWVIVVFGVLVKIAVYPLTHKSYESSAKMQELQPKLMALRDKYKGNNQRLSQETMKLYREEGVNPLGGCLPMVLQMPIFIALYQVFSSAIQLRQAPFALWITDLSMPDTVPILGFDLHVLPLLMAAAMFFQSKMTMKDPKQAALVYLMPVVMVFIMWSFSSGLVLYWTVFNVLQIGQQCLTNRLRRSTPLPAGVPLRK